MSDAYQIIIGALIGALTAAGVLAWRTRKVALWAK